MPWYITVTEKGVFHEVLAGPFERKSDAQVYLKANELLLKLKASNKGYSGEATLEIVYTDNILKVGEKVSSSDVKYGRRKKAIKHTIFKILNGFAEEGKEL
ncbi:MAG: hypothetical protein ACTSX9_08205 [Candidatus Njordarchaeales archaeon]